MTRPLVGAAIAALASASLAAGATAPREPPECIDLAPRNNTPLRGARADLARAHGGYVSSLAKFTPVLSGAASQQHTTDRLSAVDSSGPLPEERTVSEKHVMSGGIRQEIPGGLKLDITQELGPDDALPSKSRNRQFQATATQPLLRGAGLTASMADLRGATYDEKAAEADFRDLERQTILDVKLAYYAAIRDVELLRVAQSTLNADSLLVEASNAMVEAKLIGRTNTCNPINH